MTATISSTSQAVSEWVKIFPKQVTENYTSSVTFMKQLTVVAISTITYLKSALPEDSYMVESFGGIKLRILKNKCRDELAQFLSTSLAHAFDAFDKRYLHQLALCFYEEECKAENLIEYHIFEYTYHGAGEGEGGVLSVRSQARQGAPRTARFTFENVRERTVHMIRTCVVLMQSCQNELPATYDISLRLYYNEDAPVDYQAPGFQCTEGAEHLEGRLADSVRLGAVDTPYHRLLARSYVRDTAAASREAVASQNPPEITQRDDQTNDLSGEPGEADEESPRAPQAGEGQLRCPCNMQDAGPGQALLTCHYCGWRQHAACFGVRRAAAALLSRHCCAACHDARRARPPTDARLAPLSHRKRECLCLFRRTLEWCAARRALQGAALARRFAVSDLNAVKLMKLLKSHHVLDDSQHDDLNTPHKINEDQLKSVMGRFFQSGGDHDQDIVDRLLAESFASQESSDPVSDVLSPLEKVSLQNESAITRTVDPKVNNVGMEDSTLKQYREAILSDDRVELADVTEGLGKGVAKKTVKRKAEEGGAVNRMGLRSGVRTKRARTLPE